MALDALAEERLHAGLTTETLLEAILQNALALERGEGVDDVMALPLSEGDRQRLAKIVMREEDPLTADLLAGALNALRHDRQIEPARRRYQAQNCRGGAQKRRGGAAAAEAGEAGAGVEIGVGRVSALAASVVERP